MLRVVSLVVLLSFAVVACATPKGDTRSERRQYVQDMRSQTLAELYRAQPGVRARVESAAGYGVFSDVKVQIFTFGAGHGFGIAHDNRSGRDTYMRVAEIAAGIGVGVKDLRVVFVFHEPVAFRRFVEDGWEFGAEGEAAAVAGDKGAAVGAKGSATGSGAPVCSVTAASCCRAFGSGSSSSLGL